MGLLAALLSVVLPILVGMGLTWLMALAGQGSQPWYAYPLPTRLALWAGALLCGGLVAAWLGRRAGLWGMGLAAWLLWAVLSVLLSVTLTGVAVFTLIPALLAALLVALALVLEGRPRFPPAPGVALAVAAADAMQLYVPVARLASLTVAGRDLPVHASDAMLEHYTLWCYGLACDGLDVTLELAGPESVSLLVADSSPGLPAGSERLLRDRPATAVPYQEGDLTILWRRVEL